MHELLPLPCANPADTKNDNGATKEVTELSSRRTIFSLNLKEIRHSHNCVENHKIKTKTKIKSFLETNWFVGKPLTVSKPIKCRMKKKSIYTITKPNAAPPKINRFQTGHFDKFRTNDKKKLWCNFDVICRENFVSTRVLVGKREVFVRLSWWAQLNWMK